MVLRRRPVGWLPVRTNRVGGGDSAPEIRRSVYCPFETRTKTIDECTPCEFCDGSAKDGAGRVTSLLCERGVDEVPRGPALPIAALLPAESLCLRPDTTVEEAERAFAELRLAGAAVVDADGKAIGVVTRTDLLRARSDDADDHEEPKPMLRGRRGLAIDPGAGFHAEHEPKRVRDVMTPRALTLPESAPAAKAAALMAWETIHLVPVTGVDGSVTGVLSALDLLRWYANESGFPVPDRSKDR